MSFQWQKIRSLRKRARYMWKHMFTISDDLSPEKYLLEFNRVYKYASDIDTLWQLGGATNDYLRKNHAAFSPPIDLARRLLAATKPDHPDYVDIRVIGLKLLNRCAEVSPEEFVAAVVRAMRTRDDYEGSGGLCEFYYHLEWCGDDSIPSPLLVKLRQEFEPFAGRDDEPCSSKVHINVIDDILSERQNRRPGP